MEAFRRARNVSGHTIAFATSHRRGPHCGLRSAIERIFVMQPAEDRRCEHTPLRRQLMPVRLQLGGKAGCWVRHGAMGDAIAKYEEGLTNKRLAVGRCAAQWQPATRRRDRRAER
jgi:hypothetical protein